MLRQLAATSDEKFNDSRLYFGRTSDTFRCAGNVSLYEHCS